MARTKQNQRKHAKSSNPRLKKVEEKVEEKVEATVEEPPPSEEVLAKRARRKEVRIAKMAAKKLHQKLLKMSNREKKQRNSSSTSISKFEDKDHGQSAFFN